MQGTITLGSRMRETHVPAYRGRVRSGCLTCRSRKVKCDEARPNCHNCTRLARDCVYKPQRSLRPNTTVQSPSTSPEDAVQDVPTIDPTPNIGSNTIPNQGSPQEVEDCVLAEKSRLHSPLKDALGLVQDSIPSPDSSFDNYTSNLETVLRHHQEYNVDSNNSEDDVASTSTLISRDIRLTTTMDKLTAREMGLQPWFSFFVEEVDCSCITPFDALNWRRMKIDVIKIATTNATVASAVLAISALYKGLTYHLPLSKAASFWDISKRAYEDALQREDHDFDAHLPGLFLLCLFSYIDPDSDPILKAPSEAFTARLITWAARPYHPPLSLRLSAWLRLLQAAMIRGGGMGLVSDDLLGHFPSHSGPIPSLKSSTDSGSDVATHLYEVLFDPIFDFYFQLQMISGEIARLTHYHRSRGSGKDQDEVTQQIINIRSKLRDLWSRRSPTQHQTPQDLRSNVSAKIANPIITLVGLCAAAYNAEFVEIDRVLGDPVSESSESKQCMRQIRDIVEGDWNVYHEGKLNPGLLRPLFLYAIECRNCEENQWAADRLGEIKNAVCRSDFFAAFGKALSDTQIRKDRRVTSKFFCIWYFGTVPPFM